MWLLKWLFVAIAIFVGISKIAVGVPLDPWPTWVSNQPYVSKSVPPGAMIVRGSGTNAYYVLEVSPTTGALPVDVGGSSITVDYSGPTGSAVPADAAFVGGTDGTNLRGIKTDTGGELQVDVLSSALPSGASTAAKQPALGTAGTASADVITVQGITSMTPLLSAQSGTWTVQPGNTANTTPWLATINQGGNSATVSVGGALKVDASGATQPVSGTVTVSNLPTTVDTNVGAAAASTLRVSEGSRVYADSVNNIYSSTNVTTGAWVQLIASTAAAINLLCITDTGGQVMELGTGAAASETRVFLVAQGWSGCIPLRIAASTRLAVKAVTATANTGYLTISGMN